MCVRCVCELCVCAWCVSVCMWVRSKLTFTYIYVRVQERFMVRVRVDAKNNLFFWPSLSVLDLRRLALYSSV